MIRLPDDISLEQQVDAYRSRQILHSTLNDLELSRLPEDFLNRLEAPLRSLYELDMLDIIPLLQIESTCALCDYLAELYEFDSEKAFSLLELWFYPEKPSEEEKIVYGKDHTDIYTQQVDEEFELLEGDLDNLCMILTGGMCAGKSTFAFEMIKKYEEAGYEVVTCSTIKNITASRNHGKPKTCELITSDNINRIKEDLLIKKGRGEKVMFYIDEFPFLNISQQEFGEFLSELRLAGIPILLSGLDTIAAGVEIPIVNYLKEILGAKLILCKSFVKQRPSVDGRPNGDATMRQLYFTDAKGEGYFQIPELGGLPVVTIEGQDKVQYFPVNRLDHPHFALPEELQRRHWAEMNTDQQEVLKSAIKINNMYQGYPMQLPSDIPELPLRAAV